MFDHASTSTATEIVQNSTFECATNTPLSSTEKDTATLKLNQPRPRRHLAYPFRYLSLPSA